MIKRIIGRHSECDIVVNDTTDVVSRNHAVLTFTFWGKMTLFDTSQNGTFVNGERLKENEGKIIHRGDKIELARVHTVEWKDIVDPYRKIRLLLIFSLVILVLAVGGIFAMNYYYPEYFKGAKQEDKEVVVQDSVHHDTISVKPVLDEENLIDESIVYDGPYHPSVSGKNKKTPNSLEKGDSIVRKSMKKEKSPIERLR